MESMSPGTRQFVAVALLILVVLLALELVIEPLATGMSGSLTALHDARFRRARLVLLDARPLPPAGTPVPPALLVHAPGRLQAAQTVAALVGAAAARAEVTPGNTTPLDPDPANPRRVGVSLTATGTETSIENLVGEIERATPLLRLTRWTIVAPDKAGDPVRLEADVVAVWSGS